MSCRETAVSARKIPHFYIFRIAEAHPLSLLKREYKMWCFPPLLFGVLILWVGSRLLISAGVNRETAWNQDKEAIYYSDLEEPLSVHSYERHGLFEFHMFEVGGFRQFHVLGGGGEPGCSSATDANKNMPQVSLLRFEMFYILKMCPSILVFFFTKQIIIKYFCAVPCRFFCCSVKV